MMPQMDAGQPIREVPGAGYGAYEGNQSYAPPPPPQYSQGQQHSAYDGDTRARYCDLKNESGSGGQTPSPMNGAGGVGAINLAPTGRSRS